MINNKFNFQPFVVHIILGIIAKFAPVALTAYFLAFVAFATIRIIQSSDRNLLSARYALYVAGFEIVYRISGFTLVYELGKYACMLFLLLGSMLRTRQSNFKPFLFYLLLLLPAILVTPIDFGFNVYRNTVMFSLSGPITLALSGMYFYGRSITEDDLWKILRIAILPGISLLTVLALGPSVKSVELISESNFALSGGFGPNQVSTALGYFAVLLAFASLNGKVITANKVTDYLLLALFLFRALLTFSRGGIFAFIFTILGSTIAMIVFSGSFRKHAFKYSAYVVVLMVAGFCMFFVANKLTDNWLLYRYTGVSTYEVTTGQEKLNHSYLSGRERIADEEMELFKENWLIGVGAGMSKRIREITSNESAAVASHSEFSRMLAEHGVLGGLSMLLLLVWLPLIRITRKQSAMSKQFFFLFFIMGCMTMLHAAMRLALPGVIVGFAFATILSMSSHRAATRDSLQTKGEDFDDRLYR